jgi:hypothetical protein
LQGLSHEIVIAGARGRRLASALKLQLPLLIMDFTRE